MHHVIFKALEPLFILSGIAAALAYAGSQLGLIDPSRFQVALIAVAVVGIPTVIFAVWSDNHRSIIRSIGMKGIVIGAIMVALKAKSAHSVGEFLGNLTGSSVVGSTAMWLGFFALGVVILATIDKKSHAANDNDRNDRLAA